MNPYQTSGDVSGETVTIHSTGDQHHGSNRIAAEGDVRLTSEGVLTREAMTKRLHSFKNDTTTDMVRVGPAQVVRSKTGSVYTQSRHDTVMKGTITDAPKGVTFQSDEGNILQEGVVETRTDQWRENKKEHSRETSRILGNIVQSGEDVQYVVNLDREIHLRGTTIIADRDTVFEGRYLETDAHKYVNTYGTYKVRRSLASKTKKSKQTQNLTHEGTHIYSGRMIRINTKKALVQGTSLNTPALVNNTLEGLAFKASTATLQTLIKFYKGNHYNHIRQTVDAGQEVPIPSILNVGEVIGSGRGSYTDYVEGKHPSAGGILYLCGPGTSKLVPRKNKGEALQ